MIASINTKPWLAITIAKPTDHPQPSVDYMKTIANVGFDHLPFPGGRFPGTSSQSKAPDHSDLMLSRISQDLREGIKIDSY